MKTVKEIFYSVVLAVVTVTGLGCSAGGGRSGYGPSPLMYLVPALVGGAVGIGGASIYSSIASRNQQAAMQAQQASAQNQASLEREREEIRAKNVRCIGQDNLFNKTWAACNKTPHSAECKQDEKFLHEFCMSQPQQQQQQPN